MKLAGSPQLRVLVVGFAVCAGCTSFRRDGDPLAKYQQTRAEMEQVATAQAPRVKFEEKEFQKQQRLANKPVRAKDLNPENWGSSLKRLVGLGPNPAKAEEHYQAGHIEYQQAVALLEKGDVDAARPVLLAAAEQFSDAADRWPESPLEQNALYYAGEAYYFADYYAKSNHAFELLLKHHPNSRYLDPIEQRRFSIAQYWLDVYKEKRPAWYTVNLTDRSRPWNDLFGRSMKVFDRIRLDDPTGKLADDATLALANAHFAEGKYIKADEYYTDLRKTFPTSEHQFTAHFLGLKAKLLCYEGPDYGGTVLNDAESLVQTIRRQFPAEAEREREYLAKAFAEARYSKAEREYRTAQYFDQKAEFGAAKHYFASVLQDYGDTPFAEPSRQRVAEISGEPDIPPQRFEWLVDWFPREENVRPLIATDKPKTKTR